MPAGESGVWEAPRGTLIHDYSTDENGLITRANMIVGTTHNLGPINMSVNQAARSLIHEGNVDEGILNKIEMSGARLRPMSELCNTSPGRRSRHLHHHQRQQQSGNPVLAEPIESRGFSRSGLTGHGRGFFCPWRIRIPSKLSGRVRLKKAGWPFIWMDTRIGLAAAGLLFSKPILRMNLRRPGR